MMADVDVGSSQYFCMVIMLDFEETGGEVTTVMIVDHGERGDCFLLRVGDFCFYEGVSYKIPDGFRAIGISLCPNEDIILFEERGFYRYAEACYFFHGSTCKQ